MQGEQPAGLKDTHHFSKSFSEANSSHIQRTASTADDEFLPIFDAQKANEFFNILMDKGKQVGDAATRKKNELAQLGEQVTQLDTSAMKENLYRRTSTVAEKSIDLGVAAYIKTTDTLNPIYEEQSQKIKKISEETQKGIKKVKENTDQTINSVSS